MSTTSMAIFSNPLFASYSVYARNASLVVDPVRTFLRSSLIIMQIWLSFHILHAHMKEVSIIWGTLGPPH